MTRDEMLRKHRTIQSARNVMNTIAKEIGADRSKFKDIMSWKATAENSTEADLENLSTFFNDMKFYLNKIRVCRNDFQGRTKNTQNAKTRHQYKSKQRFRFIHDKAFENTGVNSPTTMTIDTFEREAELRTRRSDWTSFSMVSPVVTTGFHLLADRMGLEYPLTYKSKPAMPVYQIEKIEAPWADDLGIEIRKCVVSVSKSNRTEDPKTFFYNDVYVLTMKMNETFISSCDTDFQKARSKMERLVRDAVVDAFETEE